MTERQINWAKQHDWFVDVLASGEGVLVLDQYLDQGVLYTDSKAFVDFRALRNWAGY